MIIGGVLLGAGMVLLLEARDYLDGRASIRFTVQQIVGTANENGVEWVVLYGQQKPLYGPWLERRIYVRVTALKQALTTLAA